MNQRQADRRVRRLQRRLERLPRYERDSVSGPNRELGPLREQLDAAVAAAEELRRAALTDDERAAEDAAAAAASAAEAAEAARAAQRARHARDAAEAAEAAEKLWQASLGLIEHARLAITCRVCTQPHTVELTDSQASELRHQRNQISASHLRQDTLDRDAWAPASNRFKGLTDDPDDYSALRAYVMGWGFRHHDCRHSADTVARPAAARRAR